MRKTQRRRHGAVPAPFLALVLSAAALILGAGSGLFAQATPQPTAQSPAAQPADTAADETINFPAGRVESVVAKGKETTLELRDVPQPQPRAGEVVIKVHASAMNRGELIVGGGVQAA